jgi:small-conductance mechanosensitive channel
MTGWLPVALAVALAALGHALLRRLELRGLEWRGRLLGFAARVALWCGAAAYASHRLPELMRARDAGLAFASASLMAPLARFGERSVSALDLLELPLWLAALWLGVSLLMRGLRRQISRVAGPSAGLSGAETLTRLIRYALIGLGSLMILQASGFDVSALALFGGVLGVGIGFGLQNVTSNFVSGVLMAFERPIQPGDYVSLGALSGTVLRIGARSTWIRTPDHVTILVPNSRFLEAEVVNWSHGDPLCKLHAPIGVAYGSDVGRVRRALLEAAAGTPRVLLDPRPTADLDAFGDDGLRFDLEVWTRNPEAQHEILSALNLRIEASLRRHGIAVPYPQRDLHLRSPELLRVIDAWSRREFPELREAMPERTEPALAAEAEPDPPLERSPVLWTDAEVAALARRMRAGDGVPVADRRHRLTLHRRCFVGSEAVAWLVERAGLTRSEARALGMRLVELKQIEHVLGEHGFEDAYLFYRFRDAESAAAEPEIASTP